jgi:hypothetical protein
MGRRETGAGRYRNYLAKGLQRRRPSRLMHGAEPRPHDSDADEGEATARPFVDARAFRPATNMKFENPALAAVAQGLKPNSWLVLSRRAEALRFHPSL